MIFRSFLPVLAVLMVLLPFAAFAEDANPTNPPLPDTLQTLAAKGAQIRYLGREKGLDGWIAVQNGQEQYFYATPDREAIIMGLLFDKSGKMITIRQIQNLQKGHDPTIESLLTEDPAKKDDSLAKLQQDLSKQAQIPESQKLFNDVEKSNWIVLGDEKAPVIYAFLDPQCPHCQAFMADVRKDFIDAGQLQVRMIPVGFRDETKEQAAFLLAAQNPKDLWYRHLDGDTKALPATGDINKQAVEANVSVMQTWKLDATPIIVYKSAKGEIKIVRGRPKNPGDILNDLHG
jgi:thiol:disulfide interchange protein DsbG